MVNTNLVLGIVTAFISVISLIGGWCFTEWQRRKQAQRGEAQWLKQAQHDEAQRLKHAQHEADDRIFQAQLQHLHDQIEKLYAPLEALAVRGQAAYNAFRELYGKENLSKMYAAKVKMTDSDEEKAKKIQTSQPLRECTENVFHPINLSMAKLLQENGHLISGQGETGVYPDNFRKLFEYVGSTEMLISRWQKEDFSHLKPAHNYPSGILSEDIQPVLKSLFQRKNELIGFIGSRHPMRNVEDMA